MTNSVNNKSIVIGKLYKTTKDFCAVDLAFWKESFELRKVKKTFISKSPNSNGVHLYEQNILLIEKSSFIVPLGSSPIQSFYDQEVLDSSVINTDIANLIKAWLTTSCLFWNEQIYIPLINQESLIQCVEEVTV